MALNKKRLAIIASNRFHPGHLSHIEANAKLLETQGFDVRFSVHKQFFKFPDNRLRNRNARSSDYMQLRSSDLFIVWFPSLSVLLHMLFVRIFSPATIVFVYHEPFTSFASYRSAGFSRLKALKIFAVSRVNILLCRLSHKIILPSLRAYKAVPAARENPKRYAKINLLFVDEGRPMPTNQLRSYISYIGTIAEDHAFEEFVQLMNAIISAGALVPFKFLIATSSKIPTSLSAVIELCVSSGRLVLQSGSPMTNPAINGFYSDSFVVWNAYRRSMQSGVMPKAYMFGTPVLVSSNTKSEFFEDGIHGILISSLYSADEFKRAILSLQHSWSSVSHNCRNCYLQNFDYRALTIPYMNFVEERI